MGKEYELCKHIDNPVIVCSDSGSVVYMNTTAKVLDNYSYAKNDLEVLVASCGHGKTPMSKLYLSSLGITYDVVMTTLSDGNTMLLLDNMEYRSKNKYVFYDFYLEGILDSISDGIFLTDRYGVTLDINRTYEEIFGIEREEVVGRYVGDLLKDGIFSDSVILPVLETRAPVTKLLRTRNWKEALVTGRPVMNVSGELVMAVANVRDIQDLNALQADLQREKALNENIFGRKDLLPNVITTSEKMGRLWNYAAQIAPYPTPVLITGETGVGKEVLANYIHSHSNRADMPFLKFNCSTIPENLIESELFGYCPGAFTGANKSGKLGFLELANGGTLLLDEIGDMPLSLQAKLLRVLQEGEVYRLGDIRPRKINVRLLSATNADLEQKCKDGSFRKDLLYRINVITVRVPPLRERGNDISALAEHYRYQYCQNYGLEKIFSPEILKCFDSYRWPGNVRELKNVIESLVISSPGAILTTEYLPRIMLQNYIPMNISRKTDTLNTLKEATESLQEKLIMKALRDTGGLRKAAAMLGMNHSTLYRKIKKLGITYASSQNDR